MRCGAKYKGIEKLLTQPVGACREITHEEFISRELSSIQEIIAAGCPAHVNMVTALFGTVRKRLIERPRYSVAQPSVLIMCLVV